MFSVTADFGLVFGAQPLGALHNKFPFHVLEFEPEAYGLINRGIPEIIEPIQTTMDWLINSHFYNVRKVMNDQFVVDPSRVVMKDLLDPLPGNLIRLRPSAYNTDTRTAINQLQVTDVTQNHLRDIQLMLALGERTLGVSDQILGALSGGGRKTATEVRAASTFGISRLKTVSEYFSSMGWAPLAQMMVQNSQQYYDADKKFRIVGDLVQEAGQQFIQVNPESITGFFDFIPVDGTLPVDRMAQANLWTQMFAQIQKMPQVAQQYDLGRIFAWVAQLAGLKNINQFKIQIQPDGVLEQQAQQGNVVAGPGARPPRPTAEGQPGPPTQIPNIGNTQ